MKYKSIGSLLLDISVMAEGSGKHVDRRCKSSRFITYDGIDLIFSTIGSLSYQEVF